MYSSLDNTGTLLFGRSVSRGYWKTEIDLLLASLHLSPDIIDDLATTTVSLITLDENLNWSSWDDSFVCRCTVNCFKESPAAVWWEQSQLNYVFYWISVQNYIKLLFALQKSKLFISTGILKCLTTLYYFSNLKYFL